MHFVSAARERARSVRRAMLSACLLGAGVLHAAPCVTHTSSDRAGQAGTSAPLAFDRSLATGFATGYLNWQYLQIDFGCAGELAGVRRHMTKNGSTAGRRTLQGEALAWSLDGVSWTQVARADTSGWEAYVGYAPSAWHSLPYGWSAWLRWRTPVRARYLRFRWDGDGDVLQEVEPLFYAPPADPRLPGLEGLEEASLVPPKVRFDRGSARFVSARVPVPAVLSPDPVVQALDFLQRHRALYGLDDPLRQLFLKRVAGKSHVFFGQHEGGVPVHGAALSVLIEGGTVIAGGGLYLPGPIERQAARLRPAEARAAADAELARRGFVVRRATGEPRLFYVNPGLWDGRSPLDRGTRLAYRVPLQGRRESGAAESAWTCFVDAADGRVLKARPEVAGDAADKDFDIESGLGTSSDQENWFDARGPLSDYRGGLNDTDLEGINTWNAAHAIYDYYFNNFHRHSYDGGEDQVEITIDLVLGPEFANYAAYYSHGAEVIYVAQGQASLPLLAHEFTHGVTEHSAGFEYENQSGAADESYANVFAALISNTTAGLNSPGGSACNPASPASFASPRHVSQTCAPVSDPECDASDSAYNDCGFVHSNSKVLDRAAGLIVGGGSLNGVTVNGIGAGPAGQLYYRTLTEGLDCTSDFTEVRNWTVTYARVLQFTPAQVCAVINSFAAVGLGAPDVNCDGIEDPGASSQDADGDQRIDAFDNCPAAANPTQADQDADGLGDACDPDLDGDGIPNVTDNCALVPNPDQANLDHDALGNACDDDDDRDGVPDVRDNCPLAHNSDQRNNDHDAQGDACDPDDDNDGRPDTQDNCHRVANPDQVNSDGDRYGNACDNCSGVPNDDQLDADDDGLGNACDLDIDGDGLANNADNCPFGYNPDQEDTDNNGLGYVCDLLEQRRLNGGYSDVELLELIVRFRDINRPVRVPIGPCTDNCPDWFTPDTFMGVEFEPPFASEVRVVDERGHVLARRDAGDTRPLRFPVDADYRYRAPAEVSGGDAPLYRGRAYLLELLPAQGVVVDRPYVLKARPYTERVVP